MPTPFPASSRRLLYAPVTAGDFPALLDIYNSNPDYLEYAYGQRSVSIDTVLQDHAENAALTDAYSYGLRTASGHSLIGVAQFILQNPRDGHPWLGLLMMARQAQGRGYAKEFLDCLIHWYRENGYTSLHLGVLEKNQAVVPFYESCGFAVYEERFSEKLGRVICMAHPIQSAL